MEKSAAKRHLRPFLASILCGLLVVLCYFFVDRPVAWFMHDCRNLAGQFILWPPRLSEWLGTGVYAAIVAIVLWRIIRRGGPGQALFVAIAASAVATFAIKTVLKGAFGRTWPEPWLGDNPSLIADNVYGFFPFHFDKAHGSFPSGHAAVTFAVISVLWLARPKWRWLYGLAAAAMCMALVGLNYHFVGDVLAGAMLGSLVGLYTTRIVKV